MKSSRIYFPIFLLVLSSFNLFAQLQDTCYLPLALGNKWLYLDCTTSGLYTANATKTYELYTIEINDDSLFANKHYFNWDNYWLFYNDSTQILHASFPDQAYQMIFCNFSLNIGQSFVGHYDNNYVVFSEQVSIFDTIYSTKGFYFHTYPIGPFTWYDSYSYINKIGLAHRVYYDRSSIIAATQKKERTLIGFYLADTSLANSIQDNSHPIIQEPEIFYTSSDNKINFNTVVNHKFSFIGVPSTTDFSFINSVNLSYFYCNGIDTVFGENNTFTVNTPLNLFNTSFTKNTDLLQNGYNLYYRITATDKALKPHTSFYPENGYIKVSDIVNVKNEENLPIQYSLCQSYPNPFNPSTTINFSIPKQEFVTLKIYDILGKEVATLVNEELSPNNYIKTFNASGLSSGIYFYSLKAGNFNETRKMILAK